MHSPTSTSPEPPYPSHLWLAHLWGANHLTWAGTPTLPTPHPPPSPPLAYLYSSWSTDQHNSPVTADRGLEAYAWETERFSIFHSFISSSHIFHFWDCFATLVLTLGEIMDGERTEIKEENATYLLFLIEESEF